MLKRGQCNHIHDSDDSEDNSSSTEDSPDQLSSLERQNDTLPITIIYISLQRPHMKTLTLYYCIASGDTSENLYGSTAQWTISKVKVNNNQLHDQIVAHWSENFLSKLTNTQKQNWKENSPAFLVTTSFPFSDESIIGQAISAEESNVKKQDAYTYSHQEDSSLYIRLSTPQSPPRIEVAGASNDSAGVQVLKIKVCCVHKHKLVVLLDNNLSMSFSLITLLISCCQATQQAYLVIFNFNVSIDRFHTAYSHVYIYIYIGIYIYI